MQEFRGGLPSITQQFALIATRPGEVAARRDGAAASDLRSQEQTGILEIADQCERAAGRANVETWQLQNLRRHIHAMRQVQLGPHFAF